VWPNSIVVFGEAPKLRKVFLDIRPAHPFRIALSWPEITHLDMLSAKHPMDLFTWGVLVRCLINLVEGRVRLAAEAVCKTHSVTPFPASISRLSLPSPC
jgi:hypothetical protein